MRTIVLAFLFSLFSFSLRAQCDGCERLITHDPIGPLPFGVTVTYGGGGDGECKVSADTPPCAQMAGCQYVQITVKITGLNGDVSGRQLVHINGRWVWIDYRDEGLVNGSKEWTIGDIFDPPSTYSCGFDLLLFSLNGSEVNLTCTECDE